MPEVKMEPVIFQGEGANITLIPYGTNGLPDMSQAYDSEKTIVQSITRTGTISVADILDSNGNVAASRAQQFVETAAIQMGAYDPKIEAILSGVRLQNKATGAEMYTVTVAKVPSTTPYEYTFTNAKPLDISKMKVELVNGDVLTAAASSSELAAGSFFYDSTTGKVTFAEANKDADVLISYFYDGKNVTAIDYNDKMKTPAFMAIIRGTVYNKDETQAYYSNFIFDRATNNGDITPPAQQADPTGGWTINIKSLAARSGKKPVTIQFEPVVEQA